MKIYKTQEEVEKDIKDGVLAVDDDDVKFDCSISINASIVVKGDIKAWNINAGDITAGDITARDINAGDIKAWNINAGDIKAWDIRAGDITAGDITARDINAGDITAGDITAWDITAKHISYNAFCCAYKSIKCNSIKSRREVHQEPICLDGELTIRKGAKWI